MLPELKIASPCSVPWEQMSGDNRTRHCSQCNLSVYNFSEMTSAEIEQLIAVSNGQRLCGRLYRRADGTILTRDCPVGLRARIRRVSRRLSAAMAAAMALVFTTQACSFQGPMQGKLRVPQQPTSQPSVPQPDTAVMGDIAPPALTGFQLLVVASGGPVRDANVTVFDRKTGKAIAHGTTGQDGTFRLTRAAVGDFTILVKKTGYTGGNAFVSLTPHHIQTVTVGLHTPAEEASSFTTGMIALPAPIETVKLEESKR